MKQIKAKEMSALLAESPLGPGLYETYDKATKETGPSETILMQHEKMGIGEREWQKAFVRKNVAICYSFVGKSVEQSSLFVRKSAKTFAEFTFVRNLYPGLKGLRTSLRPYINQEWMENIPLYAAGEADNL